MPPFCFDFSKFSGGEPPDPRKNVATSALFAVSRQKPHYYCHPSFYTNCLLTHHFNLPTPLLSLNELSCLNSFQFMIMCHFSCDQAALQMVFSVCPSVCPSVTSFSLCYPHRIIMKFSGVITNDQSKVHAKGQGERSKVKVTVVKIQINRFRTVTAVWIHKWLPNDAQSLK